jgi:hypothetical protein
LQRTNSIGRAVFEATDVALNKSVYTLCFNPVGRYKKANYSLTEGNDPSCIPKPGYLIGLFGKVSYNFHSAAFTNTGNLTSEGEFSDAFSIGGWGGIYFGREILHSLIASARLSYETYGGTLIAPGKIDSIRDEVTKKIVPYQEEQMLKLKASYLHLALAGEWHFDNFLYLLGGFNFALKLNSSILVQDKIIMPGDRVYSDGSSVQTDPKAPTSLNSLSTFRVGLFAGFGINYTINEQFGAFSELQYTYHLGNLINDGNWSLRQFSFLFGLRITI